MTPMFWQNGSFTLKGREMEVNKGRLHMQAHDEVPSNNTAHTYPTKTSQKNSCKPAVFMHILQVTCVLDSGHPHQFFLGSGRLGHNKLLLGQKNEQGVKPLEI